MACNGYVVTINGREICIPIYREIVEWFKDPDPDPETRVFRDIGILATINEGITQISDRRVRDTLAEAVQSAAKAIALPDGVKLGGGLFKGHMMLAE